MEHRYKTFPPGWDNIQVPIHRRRATLAGIATYTPCLPRGIWGQRAAWLLVTMGGGRLLPGGTIHWEPPLPAEQWDTFVADLSAIAGRFDSHTVYERRRGRHGLLMLLLDGERPVGFVKATEGSAPGLLREADALRAAESASISTFQTPRIMGTGSIANWNYLVMSPLPPKMHRMPATAPEPALIEEIGTVLTNLSRPADTPLGWQPFHGDFAPWNLRRIRRGKPWLIDWEESGWAPPDADRVFYLATAQAMGVPVSAEPLEASEAVSYWWLEVNRRIAESRRAGLEMRPLDHGMLEALAAGKQ